MNHKQKHLRRIVMMSEGAGTDTTGGGGGSSDAAGATGGTDPKDTGSTTSTTSKATGDAGNAGGGSYTPPATQEALDRIIQQRLARERANLPDIDTLKARAARADELEAEMGSEQDKAVNKAKRETEAEVTTKFQGHLRSAAVREVAAGLGFHDTGDALAQLSTSGVLNGIKVNDDGSVDHAAVERELKTLATAKPYLLKTDTVQTPPAREAGIGATGSKDAEHKTSVTPGLGRLRQAYGEGTSK